MLSLLYQFPGWLQRLYRGVVWRKNTSSKVIYLTFDDGCIPEVTPRVLDLLREAGAKATFFYVGDNIRRHPELFARIVAEGHAVGNHTTRHLAGLQTPTDAYLADVEATDRLLDRVAGTERVRLFRPPYGRMRPAQKRALLRTHTIVLWDVLTHDYSPRYTPERIMQVIRRYSRPGSVVVFHDSLKAADNMLAVLPEALRFWKEQGYEVRRIED